MTPDEGHAEQIEHAEHTEHPGAKKSASGKKSAAALFDRSSLIGYPVSVQTLIQEFTKLPGIGRRSAERLVFHVLKAAPGEAEMLASAIREVKAKVGHCRVCYNLLDRTRPGSGNGGGEGGGAMLCSICADAGRRHGVVMVVEQPKDLVAFEQTGMFKGVYHVLMGRISPLEGVGPGELTIAELLTRVKDTASNSQGVAVEEIILALNPTLESDGTAMYLAEQLADARRKNQPAVRVTRLARGVPTGLQLEYANKAVLADAIEGRRPMS